MKALSLWQPHATLMARGLKRVETRSWSLEYRGPVVIHAAKRNEAHLLEHPEFQFLKRLQLPLGAALAVGELTKISRVEAIRDSLTPKEIAYGNYDDGRFGWVFGTITPFPVPIPVRGMQGLFDLDLPPVVLEMMRQGVMDQQTGVETLMVMARFNLSGFRVYASQHHSDEARTLFQQVLARLGENPELLPKQVKLF